MRDRRITLIATDKAGGPPLSPELAGLLAATRLTLPPLRTRAPDVLAWADFFIARAAAELGVPLPRLSADALQRLGTHAWPGNLLELDSVVRRGVVLCEAEALQPSDLGFGDALVVQPLTQAVDAFRTAYVAKVLAHFGGNRTQAARALGVDPRTVFRFVAKARANDD